jgi:hypothetical protein
MIVPNSTRFNPLTPLIIAVILAVFGGVAFAAETHLDVAESATKMEHLEAAKHYWDEAAEAHSNSEAHFTSLGKYEQRGLTIVARHCKAIAEQFADIATRYHAMAEEHSRLAEEL